MSRVAWISLTRKLDCDCACAGLLPRPPSPPPRPVLMLTLLAALNDIGLAFPLVPSPSFSIDCCSSSIELSFTCAFCYNFSPFF